MWFALIDFNRFVWFLFATSLFKNQLSIISTLNNKYKILLPNHASQHHSRRCHPGTSNLLWRTTLKNPHQRRAQKYNLSNQPSPHPTHIGNQGIAQGQRFLVGLKNPSNPQNPNRINSPQAQKSTIHLPPRIRRH